MVYYNCYQYCPVKNKDKKKLYLNLLCYYYWFTHKPLTAKEIHIMAHSNTIFHQLLQLVNKQEFKKIEKEFLPNRKYRSLNLWNQFSVMLFAQITNRSGLRSIVDVFKFQSNRLYHMGLKPVKRSTLSDANAKRDPKFFETVFSHLFKKCNALAPGHKFRFKNKLYSLDASTVDLCLTQFRGKFSKK